MRMIVGTVLLAAGLTVARPAAASTIVNVAATDAAGTTIELGRGRYAIEFIGTADGGAFDAYSLWLHAYAWDDPRANAGCLSDGEQCRYGFQNSFWTVIDGTSTFHQLASDLTTPVRRRTRFSTGAAANAAARAGPYVRPLEFSVEIPPNVRSQTTTVRFAVDDSSHWDNEGGVSLRVTEVPEPGVWALLVAGFGLVGAATRRRRRSFTSA